MVDDKTPAPRTSGVAHSGVKGGTEGFEPAAEGKRSDNATSNLDQARAVGQDPVREGSRQGKDADRGDPARTPAR